MLLSISMLVILVVTCLVVYYAYIKRKYLNSMNGMIISMTNAAMTSVACGIIFGILLQGSDLTLPTIIAVFIGMIVGYVTGKPVSLTASLDGITAGIMGGMMGAMTGAMVQPNYSQIMVFFIDVIYLFVAVILIRVINEETKIKMNENPNKTVIY